MIDLQKMYNDSAVARLQKLSGAKFDDFKAGDTIIVQYRAVDINPSGSVMMERTQRCEGLCISKRRSGAASAFSVRFPSGSVWLEMVFHYYSPNIEFVTLVRRGRVRRAKLFYMRERVGRATRVRTLSS